MYSDDNGGVGGERKDVWELTSRATVTAVVQCFSADNVTLSQQISVGPLPLCRLILLSRQHGIHLRIMGSYWNELRPRLVWHTLLAEKERPFVILSSISILTIHGVNSHSLRLTFNTRIPRDLNIAKKTKNLTPNCLVRLVWRTAEDKPEERKRHVGN